MDFSKVNTVLDSINKVKVADSVKDFIVDKTNTKEFLNAFIDNIDQRIEDIDKCRDTFTQVNKFLDDTKQFLIEVKGTINKVLE